MKSAGLTVNENEVVQLSDEDRKCGFGLISSIVINLDHFNYEQQVILKTLLQRPSLQSSIVSGSGVFRIHFDTTGSNSPKYLPLLSPLENAIKVSEAIDSAYNFEVNYLGFLPPPKDAGNGGDDLYDIYIIYTGNYGVTTPEDVINGQNQTYTSYIFIDPAFGSGFYTHGIAAMQITVAHELHHAIQMGNYILRLPEDRWFHELTSTAMEEFVFDSVNDYYGYMRNYFNHPETPLPSTDGYSSAIWNIFLRDKFGYDIIKRQWEMMPSMRAMFAINNSLIEYGSSFIEEFNKFAVWMYYTNYRSVPGKYFEEAVHYPAVKMTMILDYYSGLPSVNGNLRAASHNYLKYVIPANGGSSSDSLVSIITNSDVQHAVTSPLTDYPFEYELFDNSTSGERFLTNNYSSSFNVSNPAFWSVSEILNGQLVREDESSYLPPDVTTLAFPNPFIYGRNIPGYLNFAFNGKIGEKVDFNVYSPAMKLIYSSALPVGILANNSPGVRWDVRGNDAEKLQSGAYIYIIKKGDDVIKGKFVIFN